MAWLSALFKGLLEWLSAEIKKDTKASDVDATPQDLKDTWPKRIEEQEAKSSTKPSVEEPMTSKQAWLRSRERKNKK